MKTQIGRSSLFSIIRKGAYLGMLAMALASCGGDGSNTIDEDNLTDTSSFNESPISDIEARTNIQCQQNGGRIQDEVYHTTESGLNQLYGPFNRGAVSGGGATAATYVGTTMFGDIMTVSKMTNGGSSVIGYNVRISYCIYKTQDGYPYIDNSRGRETEIGAMVLDSDNYCGYGSVDSASTRVNLDRWEGTSTSGYPIRDYERTLYKTYFKPNCNGQY